MENVQNWPNLLKFFKNGPNNMIADVKTFKAIMQRP